MTRRQDLKHSRHSLGEIRDIMNSMKSLAYMETRKLDRFLDAQHAVVESLETVATDFLNFYPETLPEMDEMTSVYLIVGTERGFCGDLNQALFRYLEALLERQSVDEIMLITTGRKLHGLMEQDKRVRCQIEGASIVEEVTHVLSRIVHELSALQADYGMLCLYAFYHGQEGIIKKQLLPPFQECLHRSSSFCHPPVLNLAPEVFILELTEQYLFAAMHELLYVALMSENHHRMIHLEGAVKHLDDELENMTRQYNVLRQEEIIEEIEIILLSSASAEEKLRQLKF